MYPHNKYLFYIGAISTFTGTCLDATNTANYIVIYPLLILGITLMVLSFRKSKVNKSDAERNEIEI